jgi:hypothetical protein
MIAPAAHGHVPGQHRHPPLSAPSPQIRVPGIGPAPERSGQTWRAFLDTQAKTIPAVDFSHAGTMFVRRLYMLFIEHGTRRVHPAGSTAHPTRGVGPLSREGSKTAWKQTPLSRQSKPATRPDEDEFARQQEWPLALTSVCTS